MKISDLQDKTIINIIDGKSLGNITDLEINEKGEVIKFYTMPKRSIFHIFISNKETTFFIENIKKIGEDVILVELE